MSGVQRIHQFSPHMDRGTVASHTRIARDVLRAAGFESEIFAGELRSHVRGVGRARRARGTAGRTMLDPMTGSCTRWLSGLRSPTNCSACPKRSSSTTTTSRPCVTSGVGSDGWTAGSGRRQLRALVKRRCRHRGVALQRDRSGQRRLRGHHRGPVLPRHGQAHARRIRPCSTASRRARRRHELAVRRPRHREKANTIS